MQTMALGSFTVTGGAVVVTDPCYEPGMPYSNPPLPAPDGEWRAEAVVEGGEGRVVELRAFGPGFAESKRWAPAAFKVGVDSGKAGVFTAQTYRGANDEAFYEACYRAAEKGGGVVAGGCVSRSGEGDGEYRAWLRHDAAGRVCGVRVRFG
jgi:hypothetical protein